MLEPPIGDPAGMRALAQTLTRIGNEVGTGASVAKARVANTTFVGPAGDRFRERIHERVGSANDIAGTLLDLAGTLLRAADEVEAAIEAYNQYVARLAETHRDD